MKYIFKYKKSFFWKKEIVIGHRYESNIDKMILFLEDGGIKEIPNWKDCYLHLGPDHQLALKKDLEERVGQAIPTKEFK
jgi:hypothetical protein